MSAGLSPRLAVLIDAENSPARIADPLFEAIGSRGRACVRRIFGDFSHPGIRPWIDVLSRHALDARQHFPLTRSKNGADIALVIEAMDLLHGGLVDGFCLVSSDSDFTRLAGRIREHGLAVHGFGGSKTPSSFRLACDSFVDTDAFGLASCAAAKPDDAPSSERLHPSAAVPVLRRLIAGLDSEDGWIPLAALGVALGAQQPDFDPRAFGCARLGDLVRKAGAFEVRQRQGEGYRLRLRTADATA
ncbi:NYN domain-containing protein [Marinivivus vitaminiproducens]|uniref:NYN domain-containing protein n=1 Tax=Marinivivus vitaminiproducens TaxID=3035935 RepID=UPI0027A44A35|nr:NYN domain-containing protein [Geminicoccaceae bacterium SCSIO 64248]